MPSDSEFNRQFLPQGMIYSSTMCQYFVNMVLNPAHAKFPHAYLIHYTDDIGSMDRELHCLYDEVMTWLLVVGLLIATEKFQTLPPYQYLGCIEHTLLRPSKISIFQGDLRTLNDYQKLLGDINTIYFPHWKFQVETQQFVPHPGSGLFLK